MSAHEGSAAQDTWIDKATQRQLATDTVRADRELREKHAASLQEQAERLASEKDEKSDPLNDELQAMRSVARTLEKLPRDVQDRVVTWLCNRLPPRFEGLGGRLGG